MTELLYATTNGYKLSGANAALHKFGITLKKLSGDTPEVHELQLASQEAVAIDKAHKYFEALQEPLVVMDSGLFIDELNGFPGTYTKHALETIGEDGIIRLVQGIESRTAYTQRTVVFIDENKIKVFSSRCNGKILLEKRGTNDRGYDLIFYLPEKKKTLAELSDEERTELTSDVWEQLGEWLQEERL